MDYSYKHPIIAEKLLQLTDLLPSWVRTAFKVPKYEDAAMSKGHIAPYTHWPCQNKQTAEHIVLIHGAGAHRHWFDFIAPDLSTRYHCTAIDLPGMGDSPYREKYGIDDLLCAVTDVVAHVDKNHGTSSVNKPWLAGHSFGGSVCMLYALRYEHNISGLIIADTPIRPPTYNYDNHSSSAPIRKKRLYPDFESIYQRYRLIPEQECKEPELLEYIKLLSMRETNAGWEWKFDDSVLKSIRREELPARMVYVESTTNHPKMLIYGEKSYFFSDNIVLPYLTQQARKINMPIVKMTDCHHHMLFDKPQEFAALIGNFVQYHTS